MLSNFDNTFKQIQFLADHIRKDVEKNLNQRFKTWDLLELTLPTDDSAYYKMKIKVDDNGHVKVKTAQKEPGKDWDVHIEEYDKGKRAIKNDSDNARDTNKAGRMLKREQDSKMINSDKLDKINTPEKRNDIRKADNNNKLSTRNVARGRELINLDKVLKQEMQSIADSIQKDVETMLDRTFNVFDVLEHCTSSHKGKTEHNMKIKVDDGGHVKVRTAPNRSGKEWDTHVDEYNPGKPMKNDLHSPQAAPKSRRMSNADKSLKTDKVSSPKNLNEANSLHKLDSSKKSKVSTRGDELAMMDKLLNDRFQSFADLFKKDIESMLDRTFKIFDVFEHNTSLDKENRDHNMKIKVGDGGHVKVKATPDESGKNWNVNVEEYNKGKAMNSPTLSPKTAEQAKSPATPDKIESISKPNKADQMEKVNRPNEINTKRADRGVRSTSIDKLFDSQFQSIADAIQKDVESMLDKTFNIFDVFEHSTSSDKGKTDYNMKIKVDDDGHVKVRTSPNESGKDWNVHIEEYDKDKATKSDSNLNNSKIERSAQPTLSDKKDSVNKADKTDKPSTPKIADNSSNKLNTKRATLGHELDDIDNLFNKEFQLIADLIQKDVESMLDKTFDVFDVFEHSTSPNEDKTNYNMNIRVGDNDHLKVKATPNKIDKRWDVEIEECQPEKMEKNDPQDDTRLEKNERMTKTDRTPEAAKIDNIPKIDSPSEIDARKAALDQELSDLDRLLKLEMQTIANFIQKDVELLYDRTFRLFDVSEYSTSCNKGKTAYDMRIKVDDDEFINVRAVPKDSGKDWDIFIKEDEEARAYDQQKDQKRFSNMGQANMTFNKNLMNQHNQNDQHVTSGAA